MKKIHVCHARDLNCEFRGGRNFGSVFKLEVTFVTRFVKIYS